MTFRSILTTLATAFLGTAGAFSFGQAADMAYKAAPLPMAAPYNWTGFFVGLDLGGAFSAQPLNLGAGGTAIGATPAAIAANQAFLDSITNPGVLGTGATGAVGGVHAGFNQQVNSMLVLGVEADFAVSGLNSNANNLSNLNAAALTTTYAAGIPWYGLLGAKVGIVFEPRLMGFVEGGGALGEIKQNASISSVATGPLSGAIDNVHGGWFIGTGIEYAVTDHFSIRGKWDYINLGSNGIQLSGPAVGPAAGAGIVAFNPNTTAAFNVVTLGGSIKF